MKNQNTKSEKNPTALYSCLRKSRSKLNNTQKLINPLWQQFGQRFRQS